MSRIELSERQADILKDIKKKLVIPCQICGGFGYLENNDRCECMRIFEYIMCLVKANIPENYWELSLDTLEVGEAYKKFVRLVTKHIDKAVTRSLGAIFTGPNGVGKTSLLCEIGKRSITSRYHDSVLYLTLQQFMDAHYDRQESKESEYCALSTIRNASIILLDELDKVYIKKESDFVARTLEDFFRDSLSSGRAIFTATNWSLEDIRDVFGESFVSLITRNIKIIEFEGEDYSQKRQDGWFDMLKKEVDYYSEDIIKMSNDLSNVLRSEEIGE
jgi:DNA replication protein DnaC